MNFSENVGVNHPKLDSQPSVPTPLPSDTDWLARPFPKVINDLLAVQKQQQALNGENDERNCDNKEREKDLG